MSDGLMERQSAIKQMGQRGVRRGADRGADRGGGGREPKSDRERNIEQNSTRWRARQYNNKKCEMDLIRYIDNTRKHAGEKKR